MKIGYSKDFDKKVDKLNDKLAKKRLDLLIDKLKKAKDLSEIQNVVQLKGMQGLFRITTGDYRLIVKRIKNEIIIILLIDYRRRNEKTYRGLN
jgi:mRNA-degrading endonuclease RelE of RelBE toxin-antitoxin system